MATPESTAQSIICCIGEDVAGRPTQFLLERAIEAERMHWQALSVEVRPDRLALVCQATLAMQFRGLRFYDSIEKAAWQQLTLPGTLEHFVGSVTSALNIGEGWQAWDNRGPAWQSVLSQSNSAPELTAVWLYGDSLETRSLFAALVTSAEWNHWIWTDAPTELRNIEIPRVRTAVAEGRIFFQTEQPQEEGLRTLLGCSPLDLTSEAPPPPEPLAIIAADENLPNLLGEVLSQWNVKLAVASQLKLPNTLEALVSQQISEVDLAVAGEAYDFFRWTNKVADLGLLRDAYDEYCDF